MGIYIYIYIYQCCKGIVKALIMIGAVVNYGVYAHDRPDGTWDFPLMIQMNIRVRVLYSSNIVPMYVYI